VLGTVPTDTSTEVCTNAEIRIKFQSINDVEFLVFKLTFSWRISRCELSGRNNYLDDVAIISRFGLNPTSNYCIVNGSFRLRGNDVVFSQTRLLSLDTEYSFLVVGDQVIDDNVDEGILSYYGVSMNGDYEASFRTVVNDNGTGGACIIDRVNINPSSYLFKTSQNAAHEDDADVGSPSFDIAADRDKLFTANAYTANGQIIVPIAGYNWDWDISSLNTSVVDFQAGVIDIADNERLAYAVPGNTNGRSIINATVDMSGHPTNVSTLGNGEFRDAPVYVFICDNPWPISVGGVWEPWRPSPNPYNFDIYYCRDSGDVGTYDDLPAFDSEGVQGQNPPGVLSQYYFAYAPPLSPSEIHTAESLGGATEGGQVYLSWLPVAGSASYNVYWGRQQGDYNFFVNTTDSDYVVEDLENGRTYYFNVTAISSQNAESAFFGEVSVAPADSTPPPAPENLAISESEATFVRLNWDVSEGATRYEVSYGLNSVPPFGVNRNVENFNSVMIDRLNPGTTYYFAVRAYDNSNNASEYSNVVNATLPLE
jgi:hypothetical protein